MSAVTGNLGRLQFLEAVRKQLNKTQAVRVAHTVTSGEISAGYASIQVTWSVPFPDDQYTVGPGIEDLSGTPGGDYSTLDIHNKIATGCLIFLWFDPSAQAGDHLLLHAIAIHD